jgi:hypothetical protein
VVRVLAGRVVDESTGNVDAGLSVVLDAMEQLGPSVAVQQSVSWRGGRSCSSSGSRPEGTREATGGARVALRQGFRAAGVGDPTPASGGGEVDVMLMLEELPTLLRDES